MYRDLQGFFKTFRNLPLTDFILEYTDDNIGILNTHSSNLSKKGIFFRLMSFFRKSILSSSFYKPKIDQESILIISNSVNEHEASLSLQEIENTPVFFIGSTPNKHHINCYVLGFLLLPLILLKIYKEADNRTIVSLPYTLDQLMISTGLYFYYRKLFSKQISLLVISNHLSPETRAAMLLAKEHNIKIVYIQHSQLVSKYPPIECDIFFLTGEDSKRKLSNINGKIDDSIVHLIGSPKLDRYSIKKIHSLDEISICINPGANYKRVTDLIFSLKKNFVTSKISIRPHPVLRKEYILPYKSLMSKGIALITPDKESLLDFMERSDVVISDDSGIFYEAGYVGNLSLSYRMSSYSKDWYDLEGSEIHKIYDSPQELINRLTEMLSLKDNVRDDFKIFFSNIGTLYDNKSTLHLLKLIKEI